MTQLIDEQRKAKESGDIGEIEKHGVNTGHLAVNPFNGERVPVWVANYILMDYGTGAIMSVPAHDERDFEFAKKYGIEIRQVIVPSVAAEARARHHKTLPNFPSPPLDGKLINSGEFTGLTCAEAHQENVRLRRATQLRQSDRDLPAEGLGHFAAALLGHADSDGVLRERMAWSRLRRKTCR